jgi:hypothetical protein
VVDQFPADIGVPDDTGIYTIYRTTRLLVLGGRAYAIGLTDNQPTVLASANVTGPLEVMHGRQVRHVDTEQGRWTIDRSTNCGCRSPLKRMSHTAVLKAIGVAA